LDSLSRSSSPGSSRSRRQAGDLGSREQGGGFGCGRDDGLLAAAALAYRRAGDPARASTLIRNERDRLMRLVSLYPGDHQSLVMLAALAAVDDRRNDALSSLRRAFDVAPYPILFMPTMPWFSSLNGTPGYDVLLAEREKRRTTILARLGEPPI
jgi:hypothetical protein